MILLKKNRLRTLGLLAVLCCLGSCSEDEDYVRIVVRTTDPTVGISALDLRVAIQGGGKNSAFVYQGNTKQRPDPASPDLSDFTVSFGDKDSAGTPQEIDIRVATRPSGKAFDWGGDVHLALPGAARVVPLSITAGEQVLRQINPLDGDTQSIAGYAPGVALAWPTTTQNNTRVSILPINPERVQGFERPPEFGRAAKKIRVAARTAPSFISDLYVASWIEEGLRPTLRAEVRNQKTDDNPKPIEDLPGITDLHVACDRVKASRIPIVSAALAEGRVVLYGHDETGKPITGRILSDALTPVNGITGIAVTGDNTVTLVVSGNGSRLVQVSIAPDSLGKLVAQQNLNGTPVAMSLDAEGTRILIATVVRSGGGQEGELFLQSYSTKNPSPTEATPIRVAKFPFTVGDPAARVALASCAIAWPQKRQDGSDLTDIWFSQLDLDSKPTGEAHVANVSQEGHHWAPSLVCLSALRVFMTMYAGPNTRGNNAALTLRRLPTK